LSIFLLGEVGIFAMLIAFVVVVFFKISLPSEKVIFVNYYTIIVGGLGYSN